VTGPVEEHLAAISSHLYRFISLLFDLLNFDVLIFRFSSTAILSSNIRISFAVKLHFLFLFSFAKLAIVAGVSDRWLQKTGSKCTKSIMAQEVGCNWILIAVNKSVSN